MKSAAIAFLAAGLLLCPILGSAPAFAVKDIVIDPRTGEVTVTGEPADEKPAEEENGREPEDEGAEDRIRRLRRAVELQQKVIRRQRALIEELRKENRRLERLLLGYDQLLRRCR